MSKLVLEWAFFRESVIMALSAIRMAKLRSVLTLLGIAVGVFSIISVMTAVTVLRTRVEEGISALGANTFQVQKTSREIGGDHEAHRRQHNRKDITYEQALLVRERATLADAVGIEVYRGGRVVFWEGVKTNPNVIFYGENVDGLTTNDWTVEVGRGISERDLEMATSVVVLGKSVAEKLFPPSVSPLGERVRVDGQLYTVIGVFEKKGTSLGGDSDNFIVIPITTMFETIGRANRSMHIMVKAKSRDVVDDAIEQTRSILRTARHVAPGAEDDFSYFSNDSMIKQFNDFTFYLRLGVLVVSSIALLAAGVGIMNIMLVSVTERTREIGIRKAVGAQRKVILTQFIIEAIILCEIGGLFGIVLGIFGGNIVAALTEGPAVIPWDWVGIGIAVCSLVGLIFGVYPAWKASMLDPIEALRYE